MAFASIDNPVTIQYFSLPDSHSGKAHQTFCICSSSFKVNLNCTAGSYTFMTVSLGIKCNAFHSISTAFIWSQRRRSLRRPDRSMKIPCLLAKRQISLESGIWVCSPSYLVLPTIFLAVGLVEYISRLGRACGTRCEPKLSLDTLCHPFAL